MVTTRANDFHKPFPGEKSPQIRHISRKKNVTSSPYLDYRSLKVASKNNGVSQTNKKLLVSLTCSQIWRSPLLEDRQSTHTSWNWEKNQNPLVGGTWRNGKFLLEIGVLQLYIYLRNCHFSLGLESAWLVLSRGIWAKYAKGLFNASSTKLYYCILFFTPSALCP
jgi:hypothetical protein